jgi:hypothetical protein
LTVVYAVKELPFLIMEETLPGKPLGNVVKTSAKFSKMFSSIAYPLIFVPLISRWKGVEAVSGIWWNSKKNDKIIY